MKEAEHSTKAATGVCLIAAPVLLLVGQLFHPTDSTDPAEQLTVVADNLGRWYAAHVVQLIAFILFMPAVLGLAHLTQARRPGLATIGSRLVLTGVAFIAALIGADGVGAYIVADVSPDSAVSAAIFEGFMESSAMLPLYAGSLLFGIGLVVVSVGLHRSGVVPRWSAVALGGGGALIDIGYSAGVQVVVWGGVVLILVGMAAIGYGLLTRPSTSAPRDRTDSVPLTAR